MEASPEEVMGSNDLTHIVKGKRTKRQRPPSPLASFTMNNTTSSSSAGGGSGIGGGGGIGEDDYNYYPSPTTSSTELFVGDESTEEEEDLANCLIMLAQGQGRESLKRIEEGGGGGGGGGAALERSSSRRFTEAATTTAGKAGLYVYECKTCNRCFPSFQALGGHRASHKKPKAMMAEKENNKKGTTSLIMALSPEEDESQFNTNSPRPLPLHQMPNNISSGRSLYSNNNHNTNNKPKVHECSICGSEFSSGQALGGHMRRHRSAAAPSTTNNSAMTTMRPASFEDEETHKPRNVLQLDLNLPAPPDEDHLHRESKFSFASKQQQQQQPPPAPPLVFSASALVDCHY